MITIIKILSIVVVCLLYIVVALKIGTTELKDIGILAKKYLTEEEKDDEILTKIDVLACQAFGLNKTLKKCLT